MDRSTRQHAREAVNRGISAWERDDFESALLVFEEVLEDHPEFADVHNKAGLCLAMMGRHDEALAHFDEALGQNSSYAEAHLNRGIVLNELGRHEEAQAAFNRAGELDSRDSRAFPSEVGNRIAVTHAQLGDLYLVANHPLEASRHYEAALAVRPRFVDIRSKFAEALIELGNLTKAREELDAILEARPSFVGARVRLGVVLHRLGDDAAAVEEWKRCAVDDPEDMRPRAYLASVGVAFPPPRAGDGDRAG
jgi:tetratricopeptide (TPR) repeat protein